MARRDERDLWVALDIGTSKCRVLVGQVMPEGHMEVISEGVAECRGVSRGAPGRRWPGRPPRWR